MSAGSEKVAQEAGSAMERVQVYLETGKKRTFAGALAWPGWCRSGKDEGAALQALLDYGARYGQVVDGTGLDLRVPAALAQFQVVERLEGDRTTDFGAPSAMPPGDSAPLDEDALNRLQALLPACWRAFDAAAASAGGRALRKGPRGGGRETEAIVRHVWEADLAYLGRVGQKPKLEDEVKPQVALTVTRQAILAALAAGARGELPTEGPRGGRRWPARYFARRVAWHVLDHAWEFEDRLRDR